jgi:hypothetical protein
MGRRCKRAATPGSPGIGSSGGNGLKLAEDSIKRTLPNQTTYIGGRAFNKNALNAGAFIVFEDLGSTQVDVRLQGDGALIATRKGMQLGSASSAASGLRLGTRSSCNFAKRVSMVPENGA